MCELLPLCVRLPASALVIDILSNYKLTSRGLSCTPESPAATLTLNSTVIVTHTSLYLSEAELYVKYKTLQAAYKTSWHHTNTLWEKKSYFSLM